MNAFGKDGIVDDDKKLINKIVSKFYANEITFDETASQATTEKYAKTC